MTLVVVIVATAVVVLVVVALPSSVITSRAVIKLVLPAPLRFPISTQTPGVVAVVVAAHVCGLWRQFCGFNAHCKHFTVVYGCQLMLGCYG